MGYFAISGVGLVIAFAIYMAYGLFLHDGSPGPYPILVQGFVGLFAFGVPLLALPVGILISMFGEDRAF